MSDGNSDETTTEGRHRPSFRLLAVLVVLVLAAAGAAIWKRIHHAPHELPFPPAGDPALAEEPDGARILELRAEAVAMVRKLVERFPDSPDAVAVLAQLHYRFGDSRAALVCWQHALELDPGYLDAYSKMAYVWKERGNYERAETCLRSVLRRAPAALSARIDLAEVLLDQGRADEAVTLLEELDSSDPRAAAGFVLLGQAYLLRRDYGRARDCFEQAVRIAPKYPNAYHGLATACARLGEADQARRFRERFETLKSRGTHDPGGALRDLNSMRRALYNVHAAAAKVYLAQGERAEAERHWRRAAEVESDALK